MNSASTPSDCQLSSADDRPQIKATLAKEVADISLALVWAIASTVLIYRSGTYYTWGLFILLAMVLLLMSKLPMLAGLRRRWVSVPGVLGMMLLLALIVARLIWCGNELTIVSGVLLLLLLSMALAGVPPWMPEVLIFPLNIFRGGLVRLRSSRSHTHPSDHRSGAIQTKRRWANLVLPLVIVGVFSGLFTLANPDLLAQVQATASRMAREFQRLFADFDAWEFVFVLLSALTFLGMAYPTATSLIPENNPQINAHSNREFSLYEAYRNSLLCSIVLFAVYLVFEFVTLWHRDFPKDFYYAGYAHQGAFWLTVALGMTTLVLSTIFGEQCLNDPRVGSLKSLAWIWSAENLLLAMAVYNRLFIYIDFNGLTRMRVLALFGIAAVVGGFIMVIVKVLRARGFVWVVHRQLWVLLATVVLYLGLPVDWCVSKWNTRHVLRGDLAPSVQIIAHRTSAEGMLPLCELTECSDPKIREGVRAMLSLWYLDLNGKTNNALDKTSNNVSDNAENQQRGTVSHDARRDSEQKSGGTDAWARNGHYCPWSNVSEGFTQTGKRQPQAWKNRQFAEQRLLTRLHGLAPQLAPYLDSPPARDDALAEFYQYAYQWY